MDLYANDGTPVGSPGQPVDIAPPQPDAQPAIPPIGNPQAFIVHHTGGSGGVDGVQATLRQRGLGVQYVMDRDGNIYQTGGAGSSHMLTGWGPKGKGLSNANTVGMEVIARDDGDVTPAQVQAAQTFINRTYPGIPVFGHGEVNPGHKEADEGMSIVNAIRNQRTAATQGTQALGYADTPPLPDDPNAPSGRGSYTKGGVTVKSMSVDENAKPSKDSKAPVGSGTGGADPYEKYLSEEPPAPPQKEPAAEDPHDKFLSEEPPPPAAPYREVGKAESAVKGLGNALTFGMSPNIAGLAEASGIPSAAKNPDEIDLNPVRPAVGAYKLLHDWYTGHPNPEVRAAYEHGRQAQQTNEDQAFEQQPGPYIGGQLAGAAATPMPFAKGLGAIEKAFIHGTTGGALYSVGDSIGHGETDPGEIVIAGEKGGLTGGLFGTAAGIGGTTAGRLYDRAAQLVRGRLDPDAEAARRVYEGYAAGRAKNGPALSPEEARVANAAGAPRSVLDMGHENTRNLARSAANTSPEARQVLQEKMSDRFRQQGPRIGGFIRKITGGANADADMEALKNAARKQNAPAYKRLFTKYPVVNVPDSVTSRPVVQQAMKDAVSLAKNRGEKLAGTPEVKTILAGDGYHIADDVANPAKTSLEYWDYVKKALDSRIEGMKRKGGIETLDSQEKADWGGLIDAKKALVDHLDKVAPEYKAVREGAAGFFGAENALEAGQNFVMRDADINEARRAFAKFTPAEKALFARGFASDLADKLEKVGFNQNVLNSAFINNKPAIEKIYMALGATRARQLEALFRVEALLQRGNHAVSGGSNTAAQLLGHGAGGATAVAAYEELKGQSFDPKAIILGAFALGGAKHGIKVIDERVAARMGEMLASSDPAVLQKGVHIVEKSPALFAALRKATGAGVRVGAQDIGPGPALAGAAAVGEDVENLFGGSEEGEHKPHETIVDQLQP